MIPFVSAALLSRSAFWFQGREKGGNVHEEGVAFERVIVHLHSRCVADDFEHEAAEHASGVGPCPPFVTEGEL